MGLRESGTAMRSMTFQGFFGQLSHLTLKQLSPMLPIASEISPDRTKTIDEGVVSQASLRPFRKARSATSFQSMVEVRNCW